MGRCIAFVMMVAGLASPGLARAAELLLTIENHKFVPAEVRVPAGTRVKLVVENRDASAEEFESFELNREKVIAGNSKAVIWIGPLKPGRYPFMGEFNASTARGVVIAE